MSQSASPNPSTAVAVSHRTIGFSFDLPPLTLDELPSAVIDAQPIFDHIEDALPRLTLPISKPSFSWLSNERRSLNDPNWYPPLENTPQYLQCRRALNDLQITLDQGQLGSCVDFERNRLVLMGVAARFGNMSYLIVPPRKIDLTLKPDSGAPMQKGPDLRPQRAPSTGSIPGSKPSRSSDQPQGLCVAGPVFACVEPPESRQVGRQLGPPISQMPGNSAQSSIRTPSIDPIAVPPDILSQLKTPARTWFPGLKGGLQLKLTNDFQVSAQLSGNPVKGTASLAIKPTLTPSAGMFSLLELPMFLNFKDQKVTSGNIDLSLKLSNLKAGRFYLSDPTVGASLQVYPNLAPFIRLGGKFDIR